MNCYRWFLSTSINGFRGFGVFLTEPTMKPHNPPYRA
jgi:hypothetical protein